jgi:hypothetical protein
VGFQFRFRVGSELVPWRFRQMSQSFHISRAKVCNRRTMFEPLAAHKHARFVCARSFEYT